MATLSHEGRLRGGLKDTTVVIVALVVAGIFALALTITQVVASPFSNIGSSYHQNIDPEISWGMMHGGMMSRMPTVSSMCPMMNGMMGYYAGVFTPLSHEDAKVIINRYLASLSNQDLLIDEFEEYSHNFYVSLIEKSTGMGAIEIIIDRYNGNLQPEPQSMMWNVKYGIMGGSRDVKMTVTSEQALKIAQGFLDIVYPGTEAGEIVAYYGYYTIMTTLNGEHYGMLSVNGYTGDVWYHTWHGMFISEIEE